MTLCSWEEHVQSNQGDVQKSMKTPSWSRSWDSMDISAFPKEYVRVLDSQAFEICMIPLEKELMAKEIKTRDEAGGTRSADMDGFELTTVDTVAINDAIKLT